MTTSADAALLIAGFKTESKPLRFFLMRESLSLLVTATVADFVEGSHLKLETPDGGVCNVDLSGCQFHYGEPREIPEPFRDPFSVAGVAGILEIVLPSGQCVYVLEL